MSRKKIKPVGIPRQAEAVNSSVVDISDWRPLFRPRKTRKGRVRINKSGARSLFRVGDVVRLKTKENWPTVNGQHLTAIVPPMKQPRRITGITPLNSMFLVGFDGNMPIHDERIFELAMAEVIPFASTLPNGMFELDEKGVITAYNPSDHAATIEGIVGQDFFNLTPRLAGFKEQYGAFVKDGLQRHFDFPDVKINFLRICYGSVVICEAKPAREGGEP